jgi:hypothetical protein
VGERSDQDCVLSHAVGLADVQNIGAKSREPQPHRLRRRRESVVYCKAPFAGPQISQGEEGKRMAARHNAIRRRSAHRATHDR